MTLPEYGALDPAITWVLVRCPACQVEWVGAGLRGSKRAEVLAGQMYCRSCQQPPPMTVVETCVGGVVTQLVSEASA